MVKLANVLLVGVTSTSLWVTPETTPPLRSTSLMCTSVALAATPVGSVNEPLMVAVVGACAAAGGCGRRRVRGCGSDPEGQGRQGWRDEPHSGTFEPWRHRAWLYPAA